MKISINISIICLFLFSNVYPQRHLGVIGIGDKVPNVSFVETKNYQGQTQSLYDFKGRYIILDFWNKGCASCIAAFPKLEELQNRFSEVLQVVLVTNNTPDQLSSLFKTSQIVKGVKLPIVMSDTLLTKSFFPHNSVPYQVWIDKNLFVKATTEGWSASQKNIEDFINDKELAFVMKEYLDDQEYEGILRCKSLLTVRDGKYVEKMRYYNALTPINVQRPGGAQHSISFPAKNYSMFMAPLLGFSPVPSSGVPITDSAGEQIGLRYFNKPLLELIKRAYGRTDIKKVIIEENAGIEPEPPPTEIEEYQLWRIRNGYCYEAVFDDFGIDKFKAQLQVDIRNYLGLRASIEKRPIDVIILYKTGRGLGKGDTSVARVPILEKSRGKYVFQNVNFEAFTNQLRYENSAENEPYLIDETGVGYKENVNISFEIENLKYDNPHLIERLSSVGLGLRRDRRVLDVLVIKKMF